MLSIFLLALGLSADASSVSMTNGLKYPKMKFSKTLLISILFGIFQGIMPFLGYMLSSMFKEELLKIIPYLSFGILLFLGIKMIFFTNDEEDVKITLRYLIIQAILTSIDAFSVGFILVYLDFLDLIYACLTMIVVTFICCFISVKIGMKIGSIYKKKSLIIGGVILIALGIKMLF